MNLSWIFNINSIYYNFKSKNSKCKCKLIKREFNHANHNIILHLKLLDFIEPACHLSSLNTMTIFLLIIKNISKSRILQAQ